MLAHPIMGFYHFNSHPEQHYSRFAICFHDWSIERAKQYPHLFQIIKEHVKPERDKVKQERDRVHWWLFNSYRQELRQAVRDLNRVLVRSRVSNFHMLAFVQKEWICNEQTIVFAFDDTYHFCLLQSSIHDHWIRRNTSTMRTDVRYGVTDCFATFPFPQNPSLDAFQQAERVGKQYYEYRRQIMLERKIGLTSTYNLFHNPTCSSHDIKYLRTLHSNMDKIIMVCYN